MEKKIKIIRNAVIVEVSAEIYRYSGYSFGLFWKYNKDMYAYELSTGRCVGYRTRNVKAPKQELIAEIQRDVDSGRIPQALETYKNIRIEKLKLLKEEYERELALYKLPLNEDI